MKVLKLKKLRGYDSSGWETPRNSRGVWGTGLKKLDKTRNKIGRLIRTEEKVRFFTNKIQ